jgi:hypothetical protein
MKTDVNGCSTTEVGQEQWEYFYSYLTGFYRVQYDYRSTDGKLFSCIAKDLDQAREKRDKWLHMRGGEP